MLNRLTFIIYGVIYLTFDPIYVWRKPLKNILKDQWDAPIYPSQWYDHKWFRIQIMLPRFCFFITFRFSRSGNWKNETTHLKHSCLCCYLWSIGCLKTAIFNNQFQILQNQLYPDTYPPYSFEQIVIVVVVVVAVVYIENLVRKFAEVAHGSIVKISILKIVSKFIGNYLRQKKCKFYQMASSLTFVLH